MSFEHPSDILAAIMPIIQEYKQYKAKRTYVGFPSMKFKEAMFNKYPDIAERAPTLFNKATDGDFEKTSELQRLQYLQQMASTVAPDSSNYTEVSRQVNDKFTDEFGVSDVINKLEAQRTSEMLPVETTAVGMTPMQ